MKQHVTVEGARNIGLRALGMLIASLAFVILILVARGAKQGSAIQPDATCCCCCE